MQEKKNCNVRLIAIPCSPTTRSFSVISTRLFPAQAGKQAADSYGFRANIYIRTSGETLQLQKGRQFKNMQNENQMQQKRAAENKQTFCTYRNTKWQTNCKQMQQSCIQHEQECVHVSLLKLQRGAPHVQITPRHDLRLSSDDNLCLFCWCWSDERVSVV